jgi:hypothetical protein
MSATLYRRCPVCGKLGKLSIEPRPPENQYAYAVHCWSCLDGPAPTSADRERRAASVRWLGELAKALGCRAGDLLYDAPRYVEHLERGTVSNGGAPPPMRRFTTYGGLLDEGVLERFREDLSAPEHDGPRNWLERRGINERTWRRAGLGWVADYGFLVIPYEGGLFKTRSPRDRVPTFAMHGKGRSWPLYVPNPDRFPKRWCMVCEGEWDALRAESAALPAVSLPLGAATWRKEWQQQLWHSLGVERVYVCLDVGAERHAERIRDALLEGGFLAQVVDLRAVPFLMTRKNSDFSDWINNGGSRRQLLDYLGREGVAERQRAR